MAHPTTDWERVGDRYYRKVKLYDAVFDPELELGHHFIAGAPYAGALALYRDERKLQAYRASQSAKAGIDIYSYSGNLIRRINWDRGAIRGFGWSDEEKLFVVTEDGTVRCYDLQGDFSQFSLGHNSDEIGVKACRFFATGFVALLNSNRLISVTHHADPRPKLLAAPPADLTVYAWSIIPPQQTLSRSVEVLLALEKTIYVVDASEAEDRILQNGPFRHVSVSPNGKFVTLYTDDGKVWVISSDFQEKLSEYDSKARTVPKDVQWCGNHSVALAWEDEVHMVGPSGMALKHFYDGFVHLLPDIDGVRIITNDVCEFLQKVPEETEEIFRIGSDAPAAVLLDAVEQLEKKSPKADDNIQMIRSNLDEAIDACVAAAGQEHSPRWQKQLLKAASFGKSVLDLYNSDEFVNMCETLRVLNAVRDYKIGMPLTYEQYFRLTPAKLIQRLMNRHEYFLAIQVAEYLRLSTDKIYIHWASQKVRTSTADEESICSTVVEKLANKRGVSFEIVARAAYDEGRAQLATKLLDHEPRAGKQVPLLLSMNEDEVALDKAIESGDTDLLFFVLLQMKTKLPLATFFRTLSSRPLALALVEASAQSNDQSLLKDLYYQDDRPIDSSDLILSEALSRSSLSQSLDKLKLAHRTLTESKHPASVQHQKSLTEAQQLLKLQESLDKDLGGGNSSGNETNYIGLSLHATISQLIRTGYTKRASKLQSDFKISDKVYSWLRLRALVAARNFAEIEELGKARKSAIGWEPYFNEVLGAGNAKLAGSFVAKCTGQTSQGRAEMYGKCGMVVEAGRELVKAKDVQSLERLRDNCGDRGALVELERMLGGLKRK